MPSPSSLPARSGRHDANTFEHAEPAPRRRFTAWLAVLLALAAVGAAFAWGPSESEGGGDRSSAPSASQAGRVAQALREQPAGVFVPAIVVFSRGDGAALDGADRAAVADRAAGLRPLSADGAAEADFAGDKVATVAVALPAQLEDEQRDSLVAAVRQTASADLPGGLRAQVTGGPAYAADLSKVFDGADTTLLIATASVVALLLLVTYRSPFLWLVPLTVVAVADRFAAIAVSRLAGPAGIDIDGSAAGITSVLVFGAGTNYALLLVARYRDELRSESDRFAAMQRAVRRTAPAVIASGTTVVLSLSTLLAADLTSNRGIGFGGAVGVLVAMVFGLVVLPACLVLPRRGLFWPFVPIPGDRVAADREGLWARLGRFVARRPKATAVACVGLLAVCAAGLLGASTGLAQNDAFRDTPESVRGQRTLESVLPAGAATPLTLLSAPPSGEAAAAAARGVDGVVSVSPPQTTGTYARSRIVLAAAPGTSASDRTIERLRDRLAGLPEADALVGGTTAEAYDVDQAVARDTRVIVPMILLIVLAVLVFLLRALLGPILLVLTVIASYFAALGASWLVFEHLYGFPALDSTVPLLSFIFLVALGVDYNIFLIARTREDTEEGRDTRTAVLRALASTGGVITSAGILLAAVFTVLGVLPLITLTQIGVIVCVGVLIDTLMVRSVLVPALVLLTGERFWWPRATGSPLRRKA
ncbi:MMPL family transporter [Yinghuangia soli]|uniref:MMPL family transporter n=1 Tax=Yinghuangia soli TaxID=2908204 RepID=A0AA41Q7A8_9ACTN|nr:MMPL family transporter [Yinghuangia soli]MCF2531492.1 MMPL family transporter [Yinghuangia soli]